MRAKLKKNPAAVALGRLGGLKGGPARTASMTPAQRKAAARKAAQARWSKSAGRTGQHTSSAQRAHGLARARSPGLKQASASGESLPQPPKPQRSPQRGKGN